MAAKIPKEVYVGRKRPPATTIQEREDQLKSLAVDLAEIQLREGTASAQVITHYLKLATVREEIERDKLRAENELLRARVEAIQSSVNSEEIARAAIEAFTGYRPSDDIPDEYLD